MFIDTHCHLTDRYADGADALINRAAFAGVGAIVCATAEPEDWAPAVALAEKHPNVFATIGIHPERALTCGLQNAQFYYSHPKIVGIGEIGLDYHPSPQCGAEVPPSEREKQAELFRAQLEAARSAGLPVAIHTRDAEEDTFGILKDFSIHGVMHCFTGTWEFAKKMLDRGFFFSASGIVTFKNSADLREVFAKIPIGRIVVETDAPYCAPVPFRGKTCEPAMVVETAKVLAEARGIPLAEFEIILEENTKKLYPKMSAAVIAVDAPAQHNTTNNLNI
jgi:TatD DNase family protein